MLFVYLLSAQGVFGCKGGKVTLVRRTLVSFLGQFPTFGLHLAPNCHLWLLVVVNTI